jgi:hypothetical protein
METKVCPKCGKSKPLSEYHFFKTGRKAGKPQGYCKPCHAVMSREWSHKTGKSIPLKSPFLGKISDDGQFKYCNRCNEILPIDRFYFNKSGKQVGKPLSYCKTCWKKIGKEHETRCVPMSENKKCSLYLGVHVAERALSKFFDHIERMPSGNKGFDFLCGRKFKIDVKSSCIRQSKIQAPFWSFGIYHNTTADYFLCLAFDNRTDLNPLHVWLIPGKIVSKYSGFMIANTPERLAFWSKYERSLESVIKCCSEMNQ